MRRSRSSTGRPWHSYGATGSRCSSYLDRIDSNLLERMQATRVPALRGGELRKLLGERFGHAEAEQTMAGLWRAASVEPGALQSNEDPSRLTPGVRDCPRSMPAWRREFHQEISNQQRLLESMGGWCG